MPASAGVTGLRRLAAVGIGCVLTLSAARVATGADTAAPSSDLSPIVIGVSNVQTGPSSDLGHELVGGSKAYFDLINRVDEFVLFDEAQYTKRDWRNWAAGHRSLWLVDAPHARRST